MINDFSNHSVIHEPFDHIVIDNFFTEEIAFDLSNEFPEFNDKLWHLYDNPIEFKKTCNIWNMFPKKTYTAFSELCSNSFVSKIETFFDTKLISDYGLHGGGWHVHSKGGKLNVHLDYNLHPKLMNKQRKINLIVYLTPNWDINWGGGLELWSHCDISNRPKELVTIVHNKFNRAVLFDTTQNSWHGLPEPINCPDSVFRKSIAVYYLKDAEINTIDRQRALFAPSKNQETDKDIIDLINKRSDSKDFSKVYRSS